MNLHISDEDCGLIDFNIKTPLFTCGQCHEPFVSIFYNAMGISPSVLTQVMLLRVVNPAEKVL